MKLSALIKDFLFHCSIERKLAPNTIEAYQHDLTSFQRFIGDSQIEEVLCVDNLKEYLAEMLSVRKFSSATARRRIACLRSLCAYANVEETLKDPFSTWAPSIKRPRRLPRALTSKEVDQLVNNKYTSSQINKETTFCILLIGATGVRVSELCGIKAGDVAEDGASIHIQGKGSRDRIVYVGNTELQTQLVARRRDRIQTSGAIGSLLLNSRSKPLQPQTLRLRLHGLRTKTDIDRRVTPHMLRHTAATFLVEAGIDIRFVQRLLGHASIATTEIYTHVSDNALKHAICKADTIGYVMQ